MAETGHPPSDPDLSPAKGYRCYARIGRHGVVPVLTWHCLSSAKVGQFEAVS